MCHIKKGHRKLPGEVLKPSPPCPQWFVGEDAGERHSSLYSAYGMRSPFSNFQIYSSQFK